MSVVTLLAYLTVYGHGVHVVESRLSRTSCSSTQSALAQNSPVFFLHFPTLARALYAFHKRCIACTYNLCRCTR
ncbi:hypothetical protein EDB84DRAFT_914469 [Lactarius hengduanensis]|nr:hypothetical protein EDB84DRAFT_914469 [Lactarius hengduanensis]